MNVLEILFWYGEIIWDYLRQMLPCMVAALVGYFLLRPLRWKRLGKMGLVSGIKREAALLLFVMFCAGLAALTVFPAGFWSVERWNSVLLGERPLFPTVDWRAQLENIQLNPFQEILRGLRGPWVMFLVLANIAIFFPVGFFTALLWRRPRWWKSISAGLSASCVIEFVQVFIGRSSDIDDVILNTTGTLVGFWLFCLVRALFPEWTKNFQCFSVQCGE